MTNVAIIGLGEIGGGIARTLARADGYSVTGYDVREEALKSLVDEVTPARSPAAAGDGAEVAFLAVMDDAQVRGVLSGENGVLAAKILPRAVVIVSTVTLETIFWAEEQTARHGVKLVDCGVSGPQGLAENAMTTMIGGDDDAYALVRPVIEVFSRPAVHCGKLGNGMRAKLARNLIIFADWMAAWEGARLAVAAGVPLDRFVEAVVASDKWVRPHMSFVEKGVGVPTPSMPMRKDVRTAVYAEKDLRAALALARELGLELPAAELTLRRFTAVVGLKEIG